MENEKIVYETIDTWKYGKATGYYNPKTDEIHLLRDTDTTLRTLVHERIHRARRNKLTFKLATKSKQSNWLMFALCLFFALGTTIISQGFLAFAIATGLSFLLLYGCEMLEENFADKETKRIMSGGVK